MTRLNVVANASGGIVPDLQPEDLPPELWTDGLNVRFEGKGGKIALGIQTMISEDNPAQGTIGNALWAMPVQTPTDYLWIIGAYQKMTMVQSDGTKTDISPATLPSAAMQSWQGGMFNGTPFFNDQVDAPYIWATPTGTTKLTQLPNWPATWLTQNLNTFKNFLVALAPTQAAHTYNRDVCWSAAAGPGEVPITWDQSDPTHEAGQVSLADTQGVLLDQLVMGNINVVYKDDSTYAMVYVGGQDIMSFKKLFGVGLLSAGCVDLLEYQGTKHVLLSNDNAYFHDGVNITPILTDYWQRTLFERMNQNALDACFVKVNPAQNEVWFCIPTGTSTACDSALTWNYVKQSFGWRALPQVVYSSKGIVPLGGAIGSDIWANDVQNWDADSSSWGARNYKPAENHLVLCSPGVKRVYAAGFGYDMDGVAYSSFLERIGITIAGQDRSGNPIYNTDVRKQVNEVWPRMKGVVGTQVMVNVGGQDSADGPITWDPNGPYPFVIGQDQKVNCFAVGRILAIRFEAKMASNWEVHGYDFDLVNLGQY